jgi:hypothetical protein
MSLVLVRLPALAETKPGEAVRLLRVGDAAAHLARAGLGSRKGRPARSPAAPVRGPGRACILVDCAMTRIGRGRSRP